MTDPQPSSSETATSEKRDAASARTRRRHHLRVVGVLVVALGLLVGGAWQLVLPLFSTESEMLDYPGPGSGTAEVLIEDPSPEAIADVLVAADVVATREAFVDAYEANPSATGIGAGTYVLAQQMTAADAVTALLDPANRTDRNLTIPAGWRETQVLAKVAEVLGVPLGDVVDAAEEVEMPEGAPDDLEGWLYADTYTISPSSTPAQVLQEMVDRTTAALDERDVSAEDREDVLIQASIVEAEVATPENRGMVARVMRNRLAGCADVGPLLQMNSTLAYGLNKSIIDLTLADIDDDSTPYNTYVYEGLPPSPINSPSAESIDVVLDPPAGDWCYFVTVDLETGETRFTDDPAEHDRNRAEYRAWRDQWLQEQSSEPTDDASDEG